MKIVSLLMVSILGAFSFSASAKTICESDGNGMSVRVEFRPIGLAVYEALVFEYDGLDVLKDPTSHYNHMGNILFNGKDGVRFYGHEDSTQFYVTIPSFDGQPLITARGTCRIE